MHILEIIAAILLLGLAVWLFARSVNAKKEGVGNCDSCSAKCPSRDTADGCGEIQFIRKTESSKVPKA